MFESNIVRLISVLCFLNIYLFCLFFNSTHKAILSYTTSYSYLDKNILLQKNETTEKLKSNQNKLYERDVFSNRELVNKPNNSFFSVHKVFYFGITHHSTIDTRLDAALSTWCARIHAFTGRKVIWYSNRPDPRIDHVISIDGIDAYVNITQRMMAVWKHVSQFYPGYDWYARFWDDNIVFPETFEDSLTDLDPNEPIEIGRLAKYPSGELVSPNNEENAAQESKLYMDGGAGSLLSRSAFEIFTQNMDVCKEWLWETQPEYACTPWCEDVLFGACLSKLFKIRYKRALGMYHTSPPVLQISDQDLKNHNRVDGENNQGWSVPRTMHYAKSQTMIDVDRLWYGNTI